MWFCRNNLHECTLNKWQGAEIQSRKQKVIQRILELLSEFLFIHFLYMIFSFWIHLVNVSALDTLPNGKNYEISYMHGETLTHVLFAKNDFIITASIDGIIKFWKKNHVGTLDFIKSFRTFTSFLFPGGMKLPDLFSD